jgi:UDP-N-acetylmuramoyl-tripeptide--D-alanyl-D-alanine ligase
VAAEKGKLIENLPSDGHAILNGDDPYVRALSSRTRAQVMFFGLSEECDLRAFDVSYGWPNRLSFTLRYQGNTWPVHSRLMNDVWMVPILASVAAALAVGVTMDDCITAIEKFEPVFGRMSLHQTQDGINFLLETKKASNWTMQQAVDYIAQAKAPKKTVVFGTISDTPGSSNRYYRKWTRQFLEAADRVICVGSRSEVMEKLMNDENKDRLFRFQSVRDADAFLKQTSTPGELIFAKSGSNLHLERIWLNRRNEVKCWLEPCPVRRPCFECRWYSTPSPPRPAGRLVNMLR